MQSAELKSCEQRHLIRLVVGCSSLPSAPRQTTTKGSRTNQHHMGMDDDDDVSPSPLAASSRHQLGRAAGARRRAELLTSGAVKNSSSSSAPCLREESQAFSWDDIDGGPPESDDSWAPFAPKDGSGLPDGKMLAGGKKLNKEQRQKLKDAEQLAEARESIRRRGWTEGEVKWRSWLARRGPTRWSTTGTCTATLRRLHPAVPRSLLAQRERGALA